MTAPRAPIGKIRIGAPSRMRVTEISSPELLPPRKYNGCAVSPEGTTYDSPGSIGAGLASPEPVNAKTPEGSAGYWPWGHYPDAA